MRRFRTLAAVLAASVLALAATVGVAAGVALTRISTDPYTNTTSQHQTEVEPDTFAAGSTIVATFQVGRFFGGGASNIGFATSTDAGSTWSNGFLPGTTKFATPAGLFDRISDPAVAFDARHGVWLISSLAITELAGGGLNGAAVLVSSSSDGLTWSNPVAVASAGPGQFFDKEWVACDSTISSPFYGNCYVEWDDNGANNLVLMSTSRNGGAIWGAALSNANNVHGIGGQPVVQPSGTVVVPFVSLAGNQILSFTSSDGGASWGKSSQIARLHDHQVAGGLRSPAFVTAEVDGAGTVYAAWPDCSFRHSCSSNDIVLSKSSDGRNWSQISRVPIDPVSSTVDHFIAGLAVDRSTSGSSAHLGLTYHYYPNAACDSSTCDLDVGFISSVDGGASWSASPTQLAGPMKLSWLANTSQGRMVGDYISTSFAGGSAHGVFAVATAPGASFDEAMFTPTLGLGAAATVSSANDAVVSTGSDQAAQTAPTTAN